MLRVLQLPPLRLCFFRLCFNSSNALKDAYRAVEQADRRLVTTPLVPPSVVFSKGLRAIDEERRLVIQVSELEVARSVELDV
jgi:hypothetical protein